MSGEAAYLYLRISRDDPNAGESGSIQNQRELLGQYARLQGLRIAGEYVDDGYSGTNYDRPGFRQLCRDIEAGRVRCVLTKDMSRLGRNSARTTDLLEEYFPARQVRYIAVSEGYDSQNLTGGMAMTAPLMLVMNEMYARDISGKIRGALQSKMERGEYIGHRPPYGYRRDPEKPTRLAVDPAAGPVVEEIFHRAAQGQSPRELARWLNERGVPTPSRYRPEARPGAEKWTARGLRKLLENPVYMGTLIQGKTQKLSFKSKSVRPVPEERRQITAHAHEAIVSQALFRQVQSRIIGRKTNALRRESLLRGLAFCGDCGRNMTPADKGRLCCGGYKNGGTRCCSNHFVEEHTLLEALWQVLKPMLTLSPEEERALTARLGALSGAARAQKAAALQRRQTLTRALGRLYQDWAQGGLPEELFLAQREAYGREWMALEPIPEPAAELPSMPQGLSRQVLQALVERVEVGQGRWETDSQGKRWRRQKIRVLLRCAAPEGPKPVHGSGVQCSGGGGVPDHGFPQTAAAGGADQWVHPLQRAAGGADFAADGVPDSPGAGEPGGGPGPDGTAHPIGGNDHAGVPGAVPDGAAGNARGICAGAAAPSPSPGGPGAAAVCTGSDRAGAGPGGAGGGPGGAFAVGNGSRDPGGPPSADLVGGAAGASGPGLGDERSPAGSLYPGLARQ